MHRQEEQSYKYIGLHKTEILLASVLPELSDQQQPCRTAAWCPHTPVSSTHQGDSRTAWLLSPPIPAFEPPDPARAAKHLL